jgi:hypothetical protein
MGLIRRALMHFTGDSAEALRNGSPGLPPGDVSYGAVITAATVVKALCYKPEGRGFETRRGE